MLHLVRDVQFGIRMLLKGRLVSAVVIVTLALAIGVTSTIVSLVGGALFRPFPGVKDPGSVVWFFERQGDVVQSGTEKLDESAAVPAFFKWKSETTTLQEFAAIMPDRLVVEGGGEPVRVKGFAATPNYFRLMGTEMAFGRDFNPDEDTPGRDQVAVLGYAFAERRYGSAIAAVGQAITAKGRTRTVIGVLPRAFGFPGLTDLWIPLVIDPEMRANKSEKRVIVFGRLKPGASTEALNAEVAALAPQLAAEFPDTNRGRSAQVLTLDEVFIAGARKLGLVILFTAFLALLVASVNVGNILFAQGLARSAEFALRAALGASRTRLVRQLLTECLVLCAAGGVLGLLISMWGLDLFVASMPESIANRVRIFWELRFDASWGAVAVVMTLMATLVAGLWPAWRVSSTAVAETLKEHGNRASLGRSHRRVLRGLVTAQVAIALALSTGAACGIVELVRFKREKLGFTPGALAAVIARETKSDDEGNARFFTELVAALRALPGVTAVGLTSDEPLTRGSERVEVAIPGRPPAAPGEELEGKLAIIHGDYFKAAGIEVLEGSVFSTKDDRQSPPVMVLSRRAADGFFPGQSAIGKTVVHIDRAKRTLCTVIGIVGDIAAYRNREVGMVYRPFAQEVRAEMAAIVQAPNAALLDRPVREAVYALDRKQPVESNLLETHVQDFFWGPSTIVRFVAIPATLAVLLAVLGVYGLAAYSVAQRRPELGIRAALGAPPRALLRLAMREAFSIAAIGGTVGLGLAFLVVTLLHQSKVQALSPGWTIALTTLLIVVVLLASYGPAKRAARASPSLAMR